MTSIRIIYADIIMDICNIVAYEPKNPKGGFLGMHYPLEAYDKADNRFAYGFTRSDEGRPSSYK